MNYLRKPSPTITYFFVIIKENIENHSCGLGDRAPVAMVTGLRDAALRDHYTHCDQMAAHQRIC